MIIVTDPCACKQEQERGGYAGKDLCRPAFSREQGDELSRPSFFGCCSLSEQGAERKVRLFCGCVEIFFGWKPVAPFFLHIGEHFLPVLGSRQP
jgi:hypothetical protein